MNRVIFSQQSNEFRTPKAFYQALDSEFRFNDDPCPVGGSGGLERSWGGGNILQSAIFGNPKVGKKGLGRTPAG